MADNCVTFTNTSTRLKTWNQFMVVTAQCDRSLASAAVTCLRPPFQVKFSSQLKGSFLTGFVGVECFSGDL